MTVSDGLYPHLPVKTIDLPGRVYDVTKSSQSLRLQQRPTRTTTLLSIFKSDLSGHFVHPIIAKYEPPGNAESSTGSFLYPMEIVVTG